MTAEYGFRTVAAADYSSDDWPQSSYGEPDITMTVGEETTEPAGFVVTPSLMTLGHYLWARPNLRLLIVSYDSTDVLQTIERGVGSNGGNWGSLYEKKRVLRISAGTPIDEFDPDPSPPADAAPSSAARAGAYGLLALWGDPGTGSRLADLLTAHSLSASVASGSGTALDGKTITGDYLTVNYTG